MSVSRIAEPAGANPRAPEYHPRLTSPRNGASDAPPARVLRSAPAGIWIPRTAVVSLLASVVPQLVHMHPYHDAYLNEVVNLALPGEPERYFELEYWGSAYREGALWLNAHAEPHAVIVTPIEPRAATRYLDRRFNTNDGARPDPSARPSSAAVPDVHHARGAL